VTTRHGLAVTSHFLSTIAAVEILAAGGNAADAALAANAVQGVVDPTTCGPGGDLFALVHVPGSSWTRGDGSLALLLGTRGGYQQPQYLLQMAALLFIAGLTPAEAQAVPRWRMESCAGSGSVLVAESRMPEDLVARLSLLGHAVGAGAALAAGWGPVSVITADAGGTRCGAADPRLATARASTH
jgi:gamma-glutamyltranspeptidase